MRIVAPSCPNQIPRQDLRGRWIHVCRSAEAVFAVQGPNACPICGELPKNIEHACKQVLADALFGWLEDPTMTDHDTSTAHVPSTLARRLAQHLALERPKHWSEVTSAFPDLREGIAADLAELRRRTKMGNTCGDYLSITAEMYLPYVTRILDGHRLSSTEHP